MPDLLPIYPPPDKRLRPPEPRILLPRPAAKSAKALTPFGEFIAALVAQVDATRVTAHIAGLVTFPTRHTLSPHNVEAAHWLQARFQELGYADSILHDFMNGGVTRHNVICTKPGDVTPGQHVIICAHFDSRMSNLADSTSAAPGADDNASGTLALLEIARVLRAIDVTHSLRLVAFSGEEQGLIGSSAYAALANSTAMQIPLLINLDMIGHPANPASPSIIVEQDMGNDVGTNDAPSQAFAAQMVQAAADYTTIQTALGPIYSSDYMPFEHFGYVCIGAFDGADTAPFYHTFNDTADKVDVGFCTEVIRMVLATVLNVAGSQIGAAMVFDPDPVTTSGNAALGLGGPTADAQRQPVSLQGLAPADAAGNHHLTGTFCQLVDSETPAVAPPAPADGVFVFKRGDAGFKDTMAYHHIERFRTDAQALGFSALAPSPIAVDAHAAISHYDPTTGSLALTSATGGAPGAAEDAAIILHEFAHAIQSTQNPGFSSTDGLGSGFGDLLPALRFAERHANPAATRGVTAPWAGSGRRYDRSWKFDDPAIIGEAARGETWASALFEIYRNLGGDSFWPSLREFARDLVLKLHLMANPMVPSIGPTAAQMAQQIEAADSNLGGWRSLANGLHRKVIYDAFERRNLAGYPAKPVDVFIDDGRAGGYQWLENYWETHEIWVRPTPYTAAQLATASPADHQEPAVGSTASLYVRVKSKGTAIAGSGPVTVKAFHCAPGMGLVWPQSWTPMNTPSVIVANLLPGAANAQIIGPFLWTPTVVGHECVLVVVECAQDPAVTQTLAPADQVEHSVLVPFDNNIAQRNLVPVPAKTGSKRGFCVNNPLNETATVEIHSRSALPKGWRTRMDSPAQVRLAPRERRWIEISLDRPFGADDAETRTPRQVQLTALLRGRPIGGMTFYLAPDSAFPRETAAPRGRAAIDLACFGIPPGACDVEGTIRIKLRLRKS